MNAKNVAKGISIGSVDAPNVLEFFWDYCCPFSAKSFAMIYSQVIPMIEALHPGQFRFVFSHQVQPWHPQSAMMHESAIAVRLIDPSLFYPYSKILFERQSEFFDDKTYNLSRSQIYDKLVQVAKQVGIDGDKIASLLAFKENPGSHNSGNEITPILIRLIRISRRQGIHYSPTVIVNGLEDGSISSSWDLETWKSYLTNLV